MKSKWIWYYGDFELYHGTKVQIRRTEGDMVLPPYWRLYEPYRSVEFRRGYRLSKRETVTVHANGVGYVFIGSEKYTLGKPFTAPAGDFVIVVRVANPTGLPAIYVEGNAVVSDGSWDAGVPRGDYRPVGYSDMYTELEFPPDEFRFAYRELTPVSKELRDDGVLYDYGEETFARISFPTSDTEVHITLGETEIEALDCDFSYLRADIPAGEETKEAMAFRYIFVPGAKDGDPAPRARYEYIPYEGGGEFHCSDERLNKIWDVAAHTFRLNSREFYLDGIKRDRWVWSGDAYQSYFINRYLHFDEDIARRTITLFGAKGEPTEHINTINDYTFYFIISVLDHYEMTGDIDFVRNMYPRMKAFIDFSISRLGENSLVEQIGADWVFIDWADFDENGPLAAEQILFCKCLTSYVECAKLLGEEYEKYEKLAEEVKKTVNSLFWCEEKGAFVDSYISPKKNVTRHANIFALLFGFADERQRKLIAENVIMNDNIPPIKTPYFKFYELMALCDIGRLDLLIGEIGKYWGAMLDAGATSFWEEFSPDKPWQDQLGMYGLKYGKSLCHAWGASPIFLIGRYLLGVRPTSPGYATLEVKPQLDGLDEVDAKLPIKGGYVHITKKDGKVETKIVR